MHFILHREDNPSTTIEISRLGNSPKVISKIVYDFGEFTGKEKANREDSLICGRTLKQETTCACNYVLVHIRHMCSEC